MFSSMFFLMLFMQKVNSVVRHLIHVLNFLTDRIDYSDKLVLNSLPRFLEHLCTS